MSAATPASRPMDSSAMGCHPRSWREDEEGPTFLCLHGLGDSGLSFDRFAASPRLSPFRILAPDLPGYGESPRPAPEQSLGQFAEEIAEILTRAQGDPPVLLGHSMGGTLAQLVAEAAPDRIRAVVNIEGNLCLNDCAWSGPIAARSLRSFLDSGLSEVLSQLDEAGRDDPEMARYAASFRLADPAAVHRHSADLVALSKPADLARRLARLPVPTLYIAGSPGGIGPHSLELLREVGANLEVLSPSGHCPHRDLPEALAGVLVDFLANL